MPTTVCPRCDEIVAAVEEHQEEEVNVMISSVEELLKEQQRDFGDLCEYVEAHDDFVRDENNLLCKEIDDKLCAVVPIGIRVRVLTYIHVPRATGHYRVKRTWHQARSRL